MKEIKTKADFEAEIKTGPARLILFYSGWCHFCSDFMPAFEKISAATPAAFIKICVDDLPEIESAFAVEVVPTVLFFKDGKLSNRLDGVLGRGISEEKMLAFSAACGVKTS
ncbi:MAG: hypothetical protein AUJ51_00095 [Elusimicrobia bacterium CG1_02_56_21]|nr:MAG: hypothetical protein AUJ51_00095 [Elusimicrobia bacterium CG1_02_56_21]